MNAVCAECASQLYGTPLPAHRFGEHFDIPDDRVLRITFTYGDVFRLSGFGTVDPSIYGDADRWTATVVEPVHGRRRDFARLYRADSGLDFNECDIIEIFDELSSTTLFRLSTVAEHLRVQRRRGTSPPTAPMVEPHALTDFLDNKQPNKPLTL